MTGARDGVIVFGLNTRKGGVAFTELQRAYLKWIWWERINRVIFNMLRLKYPIDLHRDEEAEWQLDRQLWGYTWWDVGEEIEARELPVFQAMGFSEITKGVNLEKKILQN